MIQRILFIILLCLCSTSVFAQMEEALAPLNYPLDSTETQQLRLEVDNMTFFKDNEFSGTVMKGCTLPGLWVTPKLTYQPLRNLKFEAGIHALIYSGAYRFPNYAYHDIAQWKGDQYQRGAHLLPWFRAQLTLRRVHLVLGDLYGAMKHRLAQPLYDPELMLTADPEFGFQIIADTRPAHIDAWVNWESFIFEGDTHQEAFVVGLASRFRLNSEQSRWHVYLPVQGTIQHRGGEQNKGGSVQTLCNGAAGVGLRWNVGHKVVRHVAAEALALGCAQQKGMLWPFRGGSGLYAKVDVGFKYGLSARLGYFRAHQFITLLGSPYFGAVSTKHDGACYPDHPQTAHLALDYSRTFGKHYALGAKVETFCNAPGRMRLADGTMQNTTTTFNTSFGIYLRINPSFLLKQF